MVMVRVLFRSRCNCNIFLLAWIVRAKNDQRAIQDRLLSPITFGSNTFSFCLLVGPESSIYVQAMFEIENVCPFVFRLERKLS